MGAWQSWLLSTISRGMFGEEPQTWGSHLYTELAGSLSAILMAVIALAAFWADRSSGQGLDDKPSDSQEEATQNSNFDEVNSPDITMTRRNSTVLNIPSKMSSRTNSQLHASILGLKTHKTRLKNNPNKSYRHHKERDLKATSHIPTSGANCYAMHIKQYPNPLLTTRITTDSSCASYQKKIKMDRENTEKEKIWASSMDQNSPWPGSNYTCNAWVTTSLSLAQKNKVQHYLDLEANKLSFQTCRVPVNVSTETIINQPVSPTKMVHIPDWNGDLLSLFPSFCNHGHVGMKRKRAAQEDHNEQELSRADNVRCQSSVSRPRATLKIRHPRFKRTRCYGWSSNARHQRSRPAFASFDLGAGKKSVCFSKEENACDAQTNILYSSTPSPCQAVTQLSPDKLVLSKERDYDNFDSHQMLTTANTKDFPLDLQDQKSSQSVAATPKCFRAYFKSDSIDKSQPNEFNESSKDRFITEKVCTEWKKCHTIDIENNFKCMVSLSDNLCNAGLDALTLTNSSNSHIHFTSKDLQTTHHMKDKHYRPNQNSSPPFENPLKLETNSVAPVAPHRNFTQKPQFSPQRYNRILYSHKTHRSDSIVTDADRPSEDSPDTLANLDLLKAPFVCHLNKSPNQTTPAGPVTPPTVSLDSRQLVCLYKLALKKVGVGFRISPVSPSAVHIPQKCLEDTPGAHNRLNHGEPAERPCRHHRSPCKNQSSRPFLPVSNHNHNLNRTKYERNSSIKEIPTKHDHNPTTISPKGRGSTKTRELGKFGNESLYVLTSTSTNSRAPRASPAYTNRTGLLARSPSPENRKLVNIDASCEQSSSVTTYVQGRKENKNERSRYQFISTSPKKTNKCKHVCKHEEKKKKTTNQISFVNEKERTSKDKQRRKDIGVNCNNDGATLLSYSNKRTTKGLIKPNKVISSGIGPKEKASSLERGSVAPTRSRLDKEFSVFMSNPRRKHKERVDKSTLNRLVGVVEKLTNVLETTLSPPKRKTTPKHSSQQKPAMKKLDETPNDVKPKSRPEISAKRVDVPLKLLRPVNSRPGFASRSSDNHCQAVSKRRSLSQTKYPTQPKQPGCSKTWIAKSQNNNIAPSQAKAVFSVTTKGRQSRGRRGMSSSPCCSRCGPPQLRTAARAAAKTSVLETSNSRPGDAVKPGEEISRRPQKRRQRSPSKRKNPATTKVTKRGNPDKIRQTCNVGIQWQELTHPSNISTSTKLRRSPKNFYINCCSDPNLFESSIGMSPILKKDHMTLKSPILHTTVKRNQYVLCARQAGVGAKLTLYGSSSSVPSVSGSISVDTSWDVSASQVFD